MVACNAAAINMINNKPCAHPTYLTASGLSAKYLRGIAMNRRTSMEIPSIRPISLRRPITVSIMPARCAKSPLAVVKNLLLNKIFQGCNYMIYFLLSVVFAEGETHSDLVWIVVNGTNHMAAGIGATCACTAT